MRAELLEVDDPRWASFLETTRHDFYHLPAYVSLSARHERGDAVAVYVTDGRRELLQPIIIRRIPGDGHDATTPYGYPGPLVRGPDDGAFVGAALAEGVDVLAARGIVSLFVRLHPVLNSTPPQGVGTVVRGGDTVSIDLRLPLEEQWRQTRGNHRVHINRARRGGRVMRFDDDWAHVSDFKRLYRGTMTRVSATPYYSFGDEYFDGLRAALGDRMRLAVVEADGSIAAAGLFVETCGIVQYHLSGSDPAFAREGLTKLMIDGVRLWAAARGDEVLHLGGGMGGDHDPLFHFKTGFSESRHPFHTLRVVVDPVAYARLVDARSSRTAAGDSTGDSAVPDFFPAYRSAQSDAAVGRRPSPPHVVIRELRAGDAASLGSLLARIDTQHFRPHPMTLDEAEQIVARTGQDVYLIGFEGEESVVYGMLRGWDEGFPTASVGVGVRRDRMREGFGRAMMHALHDAARDRGADTVRLRVHPDNVGARRLYESLGYHAAGVERGEILMLLDLRRG